MSSPNRVPLTQFLRKNIGLWLFLAAMWILFIGRTLVFGLTTQSQAVRTLQPDALHRVGKLALAQAGDGVAILDLSTGSLTRLFKPPANSLVTGVAISPDGKTLVMAYAQPPADLIQFGYTDLYVMPTDGSAQPTLLLDGPATDVLYQPAWSPDGKSLYFARVSTRVGQSVLTLERMAYPGGTPSVIATDASGPSPFPVDDRLAFIHRDPQDYTESLYELDPAAGSPAPLLDPKAFTSLDAVRVAPGGKSVIFSAAGSGSAMSSPSDPLYELLFGKVASAHGIPSDLWFMALDGSRPVRLTNLQMTGVVPTFGSASDEAYFVANGSLYMINITTRELSQIQVDGMSYYVAWGP